MTDVCRTKSEKEIKFIVLINHAPHIIDFKTSPKY